MTDLISCSYFIGKGIVNTPPVLCKLVYNFTFSYLCPNIFFISEKKSNEPVELESVYKKQQIKGENEKEEDKKEKIQEEKKDSLIAQIPVGIHFPSAYDISYSIINRLIIDTPTFIVKNLYNAPIPTAIMLYAILPGEVWVFVGPRLMYYLPRLLIL